MVLPRVNFTKTTAYSKLKSHLSEIQGKHLRVLFAKDPNRFQRFSIEWDGLLFDYSKNRIDEETIRLLIGLAEECRLKEAIEALFTGKTINETENRAVLHTALRDKRSSEILVDGQNIIPEIKDVLSQIKAFTESVISGEFKGYTGKPIRQVVNIGIGGSNLGPQMVTEALKAFRNHLELHFVSNIDGTHIAETLKRLDPETTLFLVVSKSFTTQETMENAQTARSWFLEQGGSEEHIAKHFVAVSTNTDAVRAFGIDSDNMFRFWDWVGGRYSLWSSVGLSISLAVGFDRFEELLAGAYEADQHFRQNAFHENIPVLMALIGIWYNNFFDAETHAILPYNQYLHRFSAYLQQGDMESNGKYIDRSGNAVNYQTGPVIWGETGTDGQHAFFQLIHQGTKLIPADFIACAISNNPLGNHQDLLMSNFFAQTEALMNGKSLEQIEAEQADFRSGLNAEAMERANWLNTFKVFEGNRPSNSFLIKQLTPEQLGKLIAIYEHKIFVQGVIWNIFSYDQWGVELGKKLALKIQEELRSGEPTENHDASTNGLINTYKKWRKEIGD